MHDLFVPLSSDAKSAKRLEYRQYLADRDGVMDVANRTLSKREEAMDAYSAVGSRPIDRALFDAQYARFDASRPTPPEVLLLLALVKFNAAEAYGVNRGYDVTLKRTLANKDDTELVLLVEETYHTKILLSATRLYGMDVSAPYQPKMGLRALIGGIVSAPEFVSRPLVLASEVVGVLAVMNLLRVTRDILKHAPEVRDAVEQRLLDVLIDEIGHVSFNRMLLGRAGLAQARMIMPMIPIALSQEIPELGALGALAPAASAEIVEYRTQGLPEVVRRNAFMC